MNENLSQIVADLLAKSEGGEALTSKIDRLRGELKKVVQSEDAPFGKFRGLLESLREIIPDEKQRYHAALKALSTTSKLSQQEIVKAIDDQLEELKILEKGIMPSLPAWRSDLKVMEARSKEVREEIAALREKIAQLESKEQEILKGMAAQEKEVETVEKAMKEIFADLGTEIISAKEKIEEFTSPRAAVQPIPRREVVKREVAVEEKTGIEQASEAPGPPAPQEPQDTEWQKKCPMCGGRMNFHDNEQLWLCYSCAYEESAKGEVPGSSKERGGHASAPKPAPVSEPLSSASPSLDDPYASLSSGEDQESERKSPSYDQPVTKTKTCPVCRNKMNWHQMEKAWQCTFCDYERRI